MNEVKFGDEGYELRMAMQESGLNPDYVKFIEGEKDVSLDGFYTVEQLEFIIKWMKEHA